MFGGTVVLDRDVIMLVKGGMVCKGGDTGEVIGRADGLEEQPAINVMFSVTKKTSARTAYFMMSSPLQLSHTVEREKRTTAMRRV